MALSKDFIVGNELPSSVGLCADLYKKVRDLRLAMQKQVDAVEAREKEIRDHIINNLSKSPDTGAAGKKYRAQIKQTTVPTAKDWDKIRAFMVENDRFDLMQKRLSNKAIEALWEEGVEVPGVDKFNKIDVSITKIR